MKELVVTSIINIHHNTVVVVMSVTLFLVQNLTLFQ